MRCLAGPSRAEGPAQLLVRPPGNSDQSRARTPASRGIMSNTPRAFPRRPVRRRRRGKGRGRRPESGSLTEGLTRRDVWSRTPCACRARGSGRRPMPTVIRVQGLRQTRSRCSHVREVCRIPQGRAPGGKEGTGGSPTQPLGDLLGLCQQLGWCPAFSSPVRRRDEFEGCQMMSAAFPTRVQSSCIPGKRENAEALTSDPLIHIDKICIM